MLFKLAKNSHFLQNRVLNMVTSVHPSIEHNIEKAQMLKKAFFHCELEAIEGGYFEFGVYEGASMYAALTIHKKLKSEIDRNFYGFDSFDDGFKYFDEKDKHPFFKEGDFKSSYNKVEKRLKKFKNVHLIKGYFEETVDSVDPQKICGDDKCSIIFIDCDLMGPALVALNFIAPLLQQGSVIILDDYWAYKGDPSKGTCGALASFLEAHPHIQVREYYNYGHGGKSFMVSRV